MDYKSCHVGADGSVFTKYPHFKARGAQALREILDWGDDVKDDPVTIQGAEDGSGVGAALIAALTLQRAREGITVGIREVEKVLGQTKAQKHQKHVDESKN